MSDIVASTRTFTTCKPKLDKEMAHCRLLCMCCHQTETDARKHAPGASEEEESMEEEESATQIGYESGPDSTDDQSE